MTVNIKRLAQGQLPLTQTTLYPAPDNTETIINTIRCVNTHTADITMNLYVRVTGSSARRIIPKNMTLKAGYLLVVDDEQNLEASDRLQGDASTADKVDYIISGMEKS